MVSSHRDDQAIARHQTATKPPASMENEKTVLPRPPAKLQIIINETQVSIEELPASNRTHYFALSDGYIYMALDPKSDGPLTFTSETLMNDVHWWAYDPPAELVFDIESIEGSAKYGLPELDTLLTTSIVGADTLQDQLRRAATTQKRTTALAALRESPEASSSPNAAVAGPSRPRPQTSATDEDTSSNEQNQQTRVISQGSTKTNMTIDSGYMSAAERYHSESSSNDPQQGYSKLSPFARFKKLLKKRGIKGKSEMKEPTGECVSCLDDFPEGEMVNVKCHGYCKECFERLVIAAMETEAMWPVKCCLKDISHAVIMKNVNASLAQKFQTKALERKVHVGDRIYCIKPGCETWIPNNWFNKSLKCASCPSCKTRVCTACRGSWHANTECPKDKDFQATVRLAEERGWKKCYNCNAFVELNTGCRHMKCRCKAEWCYVCLAKWMTCQCTERQHFEIVFDLEQRLRHAARQTRVPTIPTRQEAERIRREAERERIAVQLVEDFERRQAEELGREAERRFQEEEDIRRRREETRLTEIALMFGQIREELQVLHSSQKLRLATRSQKEYRILQERELELNNLQFLHSRDINQLETEYKNEISKQEMRFLNEYNEREREEVRVEKETSEKIEAFWKDKPDAVYNIKAAKVSHQANCIAMFRKWDFDRKTALQDLAENFESKKSLLSRTQISDMADFAWRVRSEWRDWARHKVAEVKWFEAVITERESMVRTLENQQYAMATEESETGRAL
ncbi:hypothetical protein OCU04_009755 [Sclerotinia nivalis]|uniref:RBR-type E3 ubiquitin transferase n=1 Tax=Sclerotinia nivalis TaxID=352851 RepID=A0A9X0AFQ9_9HELO|nr:hypothetical protein OCU04_009755 [Sclerotinia nivalis]